MKGRRIPELPLRLRRLIKVVLHVARHVDQQVAAQRNNVAGRLEDAIGGRSRCG